MDIFWNTGIFWEIENCLHLQKDKEYGEDRHVCGSSCVLGRGVVGVDKYGCVADEFIATSGANLARGAGEVLPRSATRRKEIRMEKINVSTDWHGYRVNYTAS